MFSGSLPRSIGGATALVLLNLEGNSLSGSLPMELGFATGLTSLNVGNNQLTGTLPNSLFDLPFLQRLGVHENQFSGTIPEDISRLSQLLTLTLGDNQFLQGGEPLPEAISKLTNLEFLSLRGLAVCGRLLESYGTQLTNLVGLVLADTRLSGDIPTSYGYLSRLQTLDLSGNNLRNEVITELGNLQEMSECCLTRHRFLGWLEFLHRREDCAVEFLLTLFFFLRIKKWYRRDIILEQ
jgi:Leucine-rich repeat (LRR) protein